MNINKIEKVIDRGETWQVTGEGINMSVPVNSTGSMQDIVQQWSEVEGNEIEFYVEPTPTYDQQKAVLKQAYKDYENDKVDAGWQRAMTAYIVDSLSDPTNVEKAERAVKAKKILEWVDHIDDEGNIGLWGNYYIQKQKIHEGEDVIPNPEIMGEPPFVPSEL